MAKNTISVAVGETRDVVDQCTAKTGTVVHRGAMIALDSDVGAVFIADCTRNTDTLTYPRSSIALYSSSALSPVLGNHASPSRFLSTVPNTRRWFYLFCCPCSWVV